MSKGKGWHGESKRHSAAARGIKTVETGLKVPGGEVPIGTTPAAPALSVEGKVIVTLMERLTGVSVRWVDSLQAARIADHGFLFPKGIPDTHYVVLEQDDDYVFLAALLKNNRASAKYRYLVTQHDWAKTIKKSGGKFF